MYLPLHKQSESQCEHSTFKGLGFRVPFWPATRFSIAPTLHVDNVHLLEENVTNYVYMGPASSRPVESFRPGAHIRVGHYVLLRPSEDCPNPVWMGRVMSEPNLTHLRPHPRSIEIVYYVPLLGQRNKTLDERYEEWDTAKCFRWTRHFQVINAVRATGMVFRSLMDAGHF